MRKLKLVGQKFGYLTVVSEAPVQEQCSVWNCICDCGNEVTVVGKMLTSEHTKSCGCYRQEKITKHSLYNHPLYRVRKGT